MIRRIQKNNETIFLVPTKSEIDLDALNAVAFGEKSFLCKCLYQNAGHNHNLAYSIPDSNLRSIKWQKIKYADVCKLLEETIELIDYLKTEGMYLKNIWLKGNDIYIQNEQFKFIYLPLQQKDDISAEEFLKKLMRIVGSVDKEVTQLRKKFKELETYHLIKKYVATLKIEKDAVQDNSIPINETEAETSLLNESSRNFIESEDETTILSQHTTAFMPNEFSECETTVLSDVTTSSEKQEFNDGELNNLYLLRASTGEQIHINKTIYSIGKDVNQMDYVLGNASVSRNHATIYSEGDKFYLVDNGSTNGSALEGVRIREGEKVELEDGYIISLGNEVFQVLLERKEL